MLLTYKEICELIERGVIDAPMENVNGASLDITLGEEIMLEASCYPLPHVVKVAKKEQIALTPSKLPHYLKPNEFLLGVSQETFKLPRNIAAEYKLKSSLARSGLNHLLAGWCDPTWHGKLTLELHSVLTHQYLELVPGMKIGQMVFWLGADVPDEHSYKNKGQYNGTDTVVPSGGLR